MLPEIAIGDAYGAAFEFAPKKFLRENNDFQYHPHPKRADFGKGNYTDDTQMSIGTALFMLSEEHISQLNIAKFYVQAYKDNPIDGYARGFQSVLNKVRGGNHLIKVLRPYSKRNGSVMRAVPLGLLKSPKEIIHFSIVQSSITHATFEGVHAATIVSLAAHYLYYNLGKKKKIIDFMKETAPDIPLIDYDKVKKPVACDAKQTISAVLALIRQHTRMSVILRNAICLGGDTDSVASVALGLASLTDQIRNDLPEHLYKELNPGTKGLSYLQTLDSQLFAKFPKTE